MPATVPATASVSPTARKPFGCGAAAASPAQRHLAGPRDQKLLSPSTSAVSDSAGRASDPAGTAPAGAGTGAAAGPVRSGRQWAPALPPPTHAPSGRAGRRPRGRALRSSLGFLTSRQPQAGALHHWAARQPPRGLARAWLRPAGAAQTPRSTLDPGCRFCQDGTGLASPAHADLRPARR